MSERSRVAESIRLTQSELRVGDFYGVVGEFDGFVVGIISKDIGLVELHRSESGEYSVEAFIHDVVE